MDFFPGGGNYIFLDWMDVHIEGFGWLGMNIKSKLHYLVFPVQHFASFPLNKVSWEGMKNMMLINFLNFGSPRCSNLLI